MGRNAAIKHYDATPAGQPMELFDTVQADAPIIERLLASPWIVRASELVARDGACSAKRLGEVVEVAWDAQHQRPASFRRDGRLYVIDGVVQVWSAERSWWDPRRRVSRRFYRVIARGGVYDLAYDRAEGTWLLLGVHD